MSISLQPSVVAHHGDKAGCRGGRRQWPNNGNQNGTTNNSTAAGNTNTVMHLKFEADLCYKIINHFIYLQVEVKLLPNQA